MKHLYASITVILCALSLAAQPATQRDRDAEAFKRSDAAQAIATAKMEEIDKELASLKDHPWAGRYYHGDGMGVNVILLLAPKSGFYFEWRGDMGLYDRNTGPLAERDGHVFLACLWPNTRRGFQGIAQELVPIHWGERHYLIAADEMIRFCNAINSGEEPRKELHGFFLLRQGDHEKPAATQPSLPPEHLKLLLSQPLTATITAVGETRKEPGLGRTVFHNTTVTLDIGGEQGAYVGMELHAITPDSPQTLEITRMEARTSTALCRRIGAIGPAPAVGWKLSTRPRWRR